MVLFSFVWRMPEGKLRLVMEKVILVWEKVINKVILIVEEIVNVGFGKVFHMIIRID